MNTYYERKANFRTYELNPELIQQIDLIAEELDVYQSELVRVLLSDSLKRLESGELILKPVRKRGKHRSHQLAI